MAKQKPLRMILELSAEDLHAINAAMGRRSVDPLPDGEGNAQGRTIAEICRDYLEYSQKTE